MLRLERRLHLSEPALVHVQLCLRGVRGERVGRVGRRELLADVRQVRLGDGLRALSRPDRLLRRAFGLLRHRVRPLKRLERLRDPPPQLGVLSLERFHLLPGSDRGGIRTRDRPLLQLASKRRHRPLELALAFPSRQTLRLRAPLRRLRRALGGRKAGAKVRGSELGRLVRDAQALFGVGDPALGVGELPRLLLRLRFLRLERGDLFAKRVSFVAGHLQLALQLRHA